MWINDKVIYTPKIVTVTDGVPVQAVIEAIGTDGTITIRLPDGTKKRVESILCKPK